MKFIHILFCLFIFSYFSVLGQKNESVPNQVVTDQEIASYDAKQKFEQDLKAQKLKIYLLGGIASVIKKEDFEFEKKYNIKYYDFGCTPPPNFKFYEQYNQLVFNHLFKENDKDWIALTNKNAFSFTKWTASNAKL